MGLRDSDRKNVDLVAGLLEMEQAADMNLFFIIESHIWEPDYK